ncbi:hypothetical protein AwErysi_04530 [Erysipelotrichaceae bacterium]|nr:hypothetical protein AwErysi_04530 [Erysipelotrichaceae bacterium]
MMKKNKAKRRFIAVVVMVVVITLMICIGRYWGGTSTPNTIAEFSPITEQIVEKPILTEKEVALLADYQAVYRMLNKQRSDGIENSVEELKLELDEKIANEEVADIEVVINKLANLLDSINDEELDEGRVYIRGLLIVNKQYCLKPSYSPGENPVAREAYDQMVIAAKADGINLYDFSTYRSYTVQKGLYNRYVEQDGLDAANRYSAAPGCSEHQSGLAFDIGGDNSAFFAETTFDDTKEAIWLAENAHKFGFILRYPIGKEAITGYMHESWHFRYVGDIAEPIFTQGNPALEEYLA